MAPPGRLVRLVPPGHREIPEQLVRPDHRAIRAILALPARLVPRDRRGLLDPLAIPAYKAQVDRRDRKVPLDRLAPPGRRALRAIPGQVDRAGLLAQVVQAAHQDRRGHRDSPVWAWTGRARGT